MTATLIPIPLTQLTEHPENPRKHFDELGLQELEASIRKYGVLTPLLARKHGNKYQVLAGARRFRACQRAELEFVPVLVHDLDDARALELVVIDNLQRWDLHPLEEAEGFKSLMVSAGYEVEAIAAKVGKSTSYVYDRLRLLQLIPPLREVFLAGEITIAHAVLLSRLASGDQERAMGVRGLNHYDGGLFRPDHFDVAPGLEIDDDRRRKAVSVRELETWINDNVRLQPEAVDDLPNLFPELHSALADAREEALKVVKITHDYRVPDAARAKERTYGRPSWKRADGEIDHGVYPPPKGPSKPCEHSVLGVVVAGPGRGDAFRVCVQKKKCEVHWKAEIKEAQARANGSPAEAKEIAAAKHQKWEEQRKRDEAERARWKAALPRLLEALAEQLRSADPLTLVDSILDKTWRGRGIPNHLERGETLEDAVRYVAFVQLGNKISDPWWGPTNGAKELKALGINAKKIVDEVSPDPAKAKKKPARAKKATTASGARARRRTKKEAQS